jgi:hypothetical protein
LAGEVRRASNLICFGHRQRFTLCKRKYFLSNI